MTPFQIDRGIAITSPAASPFFRAALPRES
jgi:hypothetical protein